MAKARASLGSFTPKPVVDGARVEADQAETVAVAASAKPVSTKPTNVTVYLPKDVVRTLKLIALDTDRRLSDICAEGIMDWLRARGHVRGEHFTS